MKLLVQVIDHLRTSDATEHLQDFIYVILTNLVCINRLKTCFYSTYELSKNFSRVLAKDIILRQLVVFCLEFLVF